MILGLHLQMMIGPTIAIPATPDLAEAVPSIQVTHNDEGKSGFQITFQIGRASLADILDYSLLANPLLRPFNRVVLTAVFNIVPRVLMDGIITNRQLSPGDAPGSATLTITGEDVSESGAGEPQYANLKGVWKDTLFVRVGYTAFVRTRYERYIGDFVLRIEASSAAGAT